VTTLYPFSVGEIVLWRSLIICNIYKDQVRTSQRTQYVSIRKANRRECIVKIMVVHCTNYIGTYKCTVWEQYGAFVLNIWIQILATTTEKFNEGWRSVLKCFFVTHVSESQRTAYVWVTTSSMCVWVKEQHVCMSKRAACVWNTTNNKCVSHRVTTNSIWVTTNNKRVSHNEQHECES
jgi:hypothetical protein